MSVDGFHALTMEGAAAGSPTAGQPHRYWARHFCAPIQGCSLVHDLVEGDGGKVGKLHFHDRTHAFYGGTHGKADDRVFADRRVDDTPGKLLGEVLSRFESPAECANILAVNKHAGIFGECPRLRFANGFEIRYTHAVRPEIRFNS